MTADDRDRVEEIDESPHEIRADIEDTREEMGGTLNALGEKLDPGRIINQTKQNVREATIGKVEDVVETAGETARGMSEMVIETIKRNPIPAAMTGIGLLMLIRNRAETTHGNGRGSYAYAGYRGSELSSGQGGQNPVASAGSAIGETAGNVAGTVSDAAGNVAGTVGRTAGDVGSQLDRVMQSSPLALGLVAVGAGAVAGALIPETTVERDVLREPSQKLTGTLQDAASDALDTIEDKAEEAQQKVTARS